VIEKERRFIYNQDFIEDGFEKHVILQGYFAHSENNHCRVRIMSNKFGYLTSKLTLKSKTKEANERNEFEFDISLMNAFEIMKQCECVVMKNRYIRGGNESLVIDDFPDSQRTIVEVEGDVGGLIVGEGMFGDEITDINVSYEEAKLLTDKYGVDKIVETFRTLVANMARRLVK